MSANILGAEIGFLLRFTQPAIMDLKMSFGTADDFGIYDVYVNKTKIGTVDFYGENIYRKDLEIGGVLFEKGNNILRFRNVGKNFKSRFFRMCIDTLEMHEKDNSSVH